VSVSTHRIITLLFVRSGWDLRGTGLNATMATATERNDIVQGVRVLWTVEISNSIDVMNVRFSAESFLCFSAVLAFVFVTFQCQFPCSPPSLSVHNRSSLPLMMACANDVFRKPVTVTPLVTENPSFVPFQPRLNNCHFPTTVQTVRLDLVGFFCVVLR
jgi:hypothetical protein